MPVRVEKRGDQYCVVKVDTGETEKCYNNEGDAKAYASALNIAHAKAKGYVHGELPLDEDVKQSLQEWDHE